MVATVLAAVAVGGGCEVSKTCSKFVSVSSSFDGVILVAGSDDGSPGEPGVTGRSMVGSSKGTGGGRPGSSIGSFSISEAIEGSATGSCTGGAGAAFGRAGAGTGLANNVAQLRVPSGFELAFCASVGGGTLSTGVTISHDASGEAVPP